MTDRERSEAIIEALGKACIAKPGSAQLITNRIKITGVQIMGYLEEIKWAGWDDRYGCAPRGPQESRRCGVELCGLVEMK